ncbi:50S ribosomal protein L11 methyltransferase [Streptomyces sp. NPDC058092]|uniref:50S ribosomal protein L11 methyltransferase n=1 Tax=Streptomyces sp. NPDC058092 TaxID=3346336 RepID=UPI0036EC89DF
MKFLKPPGVYAPQEDTAMLVSALRLEHLSPGAEVLDVGTGTGAVAIAAARYGAARATAIDTSAAAVLPTRLNALLSGHAGVIRVSRGDLTEERPAGSAQRRTPRGPPPSSALTSIGLALAPSFAFRLVHINVREVYPKMPLASSGPDRRTPGA